MTEGVSLGTGELLEGIADLYGVEIRRMDESDATFRDRILSRLSPPAPRTLDEHYEQLAKLYRFFHTPAKP